MILRFDTVILILVNVKVLLIKINDLPDFEKPNNLFLLKLLLRSNYSYITLSTLSDHTMQL